MKGKPIVRINSNRKNIVSKRIPGSCGCGKKKIIKTK